MEFLKNLQKQMKYEDEFNNDIQANPRFWTIMDYKTVPTSIDYGEDIVYYFNNGFFDSTYAL